MLNTGKLLTLPIKKSRFLSCRFFKYQTVVYQKRNDPNIGRGLPIKTSIPGVKHIVLVGSAKGGVGKSTISLNTALALKLLSPNKNIGLLDVDVFGPSVPTLLNLKRKPDLTKDNLMIPLEKYGISNMSMGFLIDEGAPIVWRGMMLMQAVQQLLKKVHWGKIDVLVVDLPPGTGDVPLSVIQNVPISGSVIVTTPNKLSLADVHRGINMFEKLKVEVFGVVENMNSFSCSNCGHTNTVFGHKNVEKFLQKMKIEKLGSIPLDCKISEGSDDGVPVMIQHPQSNSAKSFLNLASKLFEKLENLEIISKAKT